MENIPKMWKTMRKEVDLEPETELSDNVYLGCNQRLTNPDQRLLHEKNELFKKLTTHEKADAEGDLSAAGDRSSVKEARERQLGNSKIQEVPKNGSSAQYPPTRLERTKAWNYDMIGHAEQCVQRWCELANKEVKDLPHAGTPCIDDRNLRPEDLVVQGALASVCVFKNCLEMFIFGQDRKTRSALLGKYPGTKGVKMEPSM